MANVNQGAAYSDQFSSPAGKIYRNWLPQKAAITAGGIAGYTVATGTNYLGKAYQDATNKGYESIQKRVGKRMPVLTDKIGRRLNRVAGIGAGGAAAYATYRGIKALQGRADQKYSQMASTNRYLSGGNR